MTESSQTAQTSPTPCGYCGVGVEPETGVETFIELPDPYAGRASGAVASIVLGKPAAPSTREVVRERAVKGFRAVLCLPCSSLTRFGCRMTIESLLGKDFCEQFTDELLIEVGKKIRPLHEIDGAYRSHGPREPWSHVNAIDLRVDLLASVLGEPEPLPVASTQGRACGICGVARTVEWSSGAVYNGWPVCLDCDRQGCVSGALAEWHRLCVVFPELTGSYWLDGVLSPYLDLAAVDPAMPIEGLSQRFGYLTADDKHRLKVHLSNAYWQAVPAEWVKRWKRKSATETLAAAPKRFTAVGAI